MPITRRYGQDVLPQLAMLAGESQARMTGMQMDQQLAQQAAQRQQEAQRLRFKNQLQQAKMSQQRRLRQGGTPPNRAQVVYPNRAGGGGSPLQDQIKQAVQRFQQRGGMETAEPIRNESGGFIFPQTEQPDEAPSPYGDPGPDPTATLQTGDRSFTIEDDQIVTRQGGDVTGRTAVAPGPEQAISRRGQSKLAALESIGASELLNERQLTAVQQMARDDEIDLQEFRQWLGQAVRSAEAQRERAAEEGRAAGGPASMADPSQLWQAQYYSTEDEAEKVAKDAQRLYQIANPPRDDMTPEELRKHLNETRDPQQWWNPGDWGFGMAEPATTAEDVERRVNALKKYQTRRQEAEQLDKRLRTLRGETGGGGGNRYTRENPAKPETQEDFDALPSGAVFQDPDSGELMRKP